MWQHPSLLFRIENCLYIFLFSFCCKSFVLKAMMCEREWMRNRHSKWIKHSSSKSCHCILHLRNAYFAVCKSFSFKLLFCIGIDSKHGKTVDTRSQSVHCHFDDFEFSFADKMQRDHLSLAAFARCNIATSTNSALVYCYLLAVLHLLSNSLPFSIVFGSHLVFFASIVRL